MTEHCSQCGGTGKVKRVACLHCAGTGIEPEQKPESKMRHFGPFHTYPTMKRDAVIIVGLVFLLLVINMVGG